MRSTPMSEHTWVRNGLITLPGWLPVVTRSCRYKEKLSEFGMDAEAHPIACPTLCD